MMSASEGGGGVIKSGHSKKGCVTFILHISSKCRQGGEGVKNSENFSDIINRSSLMYFVRQIDIVLPVWLRRRRAASCSCPSPPCRTWAQTSVSSAAPAADPDGRTSCRSSRRPRWGRQSCRCSSSCHGSECMEREEEAVKDSEKEMQRAILVENLLELKKNPH